MAEIHDLESALRLVDGFTPLRRVLLTTPGTLQGTLSAYFGESVDVEVLSQDDDRDRKHFVREVNLVCRERRTVACHARTEVHVEDERVARMIHERHIGLGRISEALNLPAEFSLEDVGSDDGRFWRVYRLEGPGFCYRIREEFPSGLYGADPAPAGS